MKLQRYDTNFRYGMMEKSDTGEYVKHSEALAWFESLLDRKQYMGAIGLGVEKYEERHRDLIAAERGKG